MSTSGSVSRKRKRSVINLECIVYMYSIQYVCSTVRARLTLSYGFFQVTGKAGSRGARIKEI